MAAEKRGEDGSMHTQTTCSQTNKSGKKSKGIAHPKSSSRKSLSIEVTRSISKCPNCKAWEVRQPSQREMPHSLSNARCHGALRAWEDRKFWMNILGLGHRPGSVRPLAWPGTGLGNLLDLYPFGSLRVGMGLDPSRPNARWCGQALHFSLQVRVLGFFHVSAYYTYQIRQIKSTMCEAY